MSAAVSPLEQMVVVLARDLADGELGAAGAAALVPMAAIALARELHAPNLTIGGEMFFNPLPGRLYPSMLDDRALGRCEAAETFIELFGHSHHGLDFFFHSGLQHDAYGNINLHHVGGTLHAPGMRGPGAANLSYFVEKVDFITIPGHLSGPEAKREAGLTNEGPRFVVTPRAVMDFDKTTLRMRLKSVHAGNTAEEVQRHTGFDLGITGDVPQTPPPTDEELTVLRERIDKTGTLRA
jgi:glutaconate CoA-transferase subunit B